MKIEKIFTYEKIAFGVQALTLKNMNVFLPQGIASVSPFQQRWNLVPHKNPDFAQCPPAILITLEISASNLNTLEVCSLARTD
jgi:hypothetical protein